MQTDSRPRQVKALIAPKVLLVVGLLLLIFKIYFDSEPGALPLLLILLALVWYFFVRMRFRTKGLLK